MHYKWNMFKIFKPSHVSGWHLWMNWTAVSMRSKLCPPPLASAWASAPLLQITTSLSSFPPRSARTEQCVRVCLCKCVCLLTELCSFPLQMGNWKNATVLFLHSNKLESLPEEMGDMQKLKVINLSNNKWVGPDDLFKHSEGEFVTHSQLFRNSTKTGSHFAFKEHAKVVWLDDASHCCVRRPLSVYFSIEGWRIFHTASLNSVRWLQCGCLKIR